MPDTKACTKCGETRSISEFAPRKLNKDGLQGQCRACMSKCRHERYEANKEHELAVNRAWLEANRERMSKYQHEWYKANKKHANERSRQWRESNPERVAELNREWHKANRKRRITQGRQRYAANIEQERERSRRYYENNKEQSYNRVRKWNRSNRHKVAARNRKWRQANPDRLRVLKTNYYARKQSAEGSFTIADIQVIYETQNGRCVYCGISFEEVKRTIDHIIPLSRGGSNWPNNLQLLCQSCNSSKHNRTHEEHLEYLK